MNTFPIGWSQLRNVKPSSNISMENISRLHLEFQVSFLALRWHLVWRQRPPKCYMTSYFLSGPVPSEPLLCKFADGGQKKRQSQGKYLQNGRPWTRDGETVSFWLFFTSSYICEDDRYDERMLCGFFCFLQGGMTLTYDPTTALQNGSVRLVWQIPCIPRGSAIMLWWLKSVCLSADSIPPPTALPPTGWSGQPPSPHTCIHLCPPTR